MRKQMRMRLIILSSIIMLMVLSASKPAAEVKHKHVLVLHSYHKGLGWTDDIARGIEETLRASGYQIEIFTEYMDTKRIFDETYLKNLATLLKHKYRNRRFDAVISSDDHAFQFLRSHHEDMLPGVPAVFCGVNYFKDEFIDNVPYFTGVVESFSIKDTIDAALAINPNLRRVYAVVDKTVTGKANRKLLETVASQYGDRLEFITITDKDMTEVQEEVCRLPPDSIVLLLAFTSDRSGNTFSLEQSADLITAASNRPVYSFWDFHLNHGVVGGMLTTGFSQGVAAAELCLRIIGGERPGDIPVIKESPNRLIFDHNVLSRFALPVERLPSGSTVINRPLSFYEQNRRLVWQVGAAFGLLLLFTLIIAVSLLERRAAAARLKKSEDKFRSLVETTSDWIWEVDATVHFTYVSPKITELLGYTQEEVLGRTPFDFMPAAEAERVCAGFQKLISSRLPIIQEKNVNRRKDGRNVILETTGVPVLDADDSLKGYRGISRDITDRQQAEEALRESEEKYRTVLEVNPDPVVVYDMEGTVIYLNPAFMRVFGWSLEEQIGKKIDGFVPEKNWAETKAMIHKVTVLGQSFSGVETRRHTKDGSILDINISGSCYRDREGNVAASVINLRDITEQKKLEAQLQQAQKMEAIGTLASGVAHDFNNLLMAIQGRTSTMLMNKDGSHPDFEHLKGIEDHVESAADLTKQLLGVAMGGKYEPKPTDLNQLIKKQNQMFGRTKKEIIIKEKYQENLWPVEIDRGQIEQVILNLYLNAGHAMPGGGDLYVETKNVTLEEDHVKPFSAEPGRYVEISVADTGVGMDKTTLERIFDPFFTTKEIGRGTGLGLASVYGIIKNHGGFIKVHSKKGHGTNFNVYLPASEKQVIDVKAPIGDTLMGSETVLFVDDEDMIIEITEELLKRLGYRVLTARSGKEAIKTYEEYSEQIDIVVLDMIMPDMGGGDTYDGLKMLNSKVKVLLSSGYSIDGQAAEILNRGCNGFIQKPFKMKEFSQKLRNILDEE